MSEYSEVVETLGKFRVKIVVDSDAQKPEYYGMTPVLQTDSSPYSSIKAEAFNPQAEQFVDAFNRLGDLYYGNGYQYEVFERYLRIFHGATKVDSHNVGVTREYGYVAFDTAAWREEVGVGESFEAEDILHDVRAWAEGDVWGIVIEKLVTWSTDDEDFEDQDDWEEVSDETVWGFYGSSYAEEEAKSMLKDFIERQQEKQ